MILIFNDAFTGQQDISKVYMYNAATACYL